MLRVSYVFFLLFCLFSAPGQAADTYYVPDDFLKIQDAISNVLVTNGDIIYVRSGTYLENINFLGKAITVESEMGPSLTIIDGGQSSNVVRFENGENTDSVLEGFTIKNGSFYFGGGIYCFGASPTIYNNIISRNSGSGSSSRGGGIYCDNSASPSISSNILFGNSAVDGGGIYCSNSSSPTISNNTIFGNSAEKGAGIYCRSTCLVTTNRIYENTASSAGGGIWCQDAPVVDKNVIYGNTADFEGGGVWCSENTTISRNTIYGNPSDKGGGIYCTDSTIISENEIYGNPANAGGGIYYSGSPGLGVPSIEHNSISANMSYGSGGGIYYYNTATSGDQGSDAYPSILGNTLFENMAITGFGGGIYCYYAAPIIASNLFCRNTGLSGGGLHCYHASPTITNNTFYGNQADYGGGLCLELFSSPSVSNTIFWGDVATNGPEVALRYNTAPTTLNISYSDVQQGQSAIFIDPGCTLNWGLGMIDTDPLFLAESEDDFHISLSSPCHDAGDNAAPRLPESDFEQDLRIANDQVDIGADEFYLHLYHRGDTFSPGDRMTIVVTGQPQIYVTLSLGGGVLDPPQPTQYGLLYLLLPIVRQENIGAIPSNGVLITKPFVPQVAKPGKDYPVQALFGPTGSPDAKLSNLMVLEVR